MNTIQELIAQKTALERRIAEAQRSARTEAIAKVRVLMAQYGLTATDIVARAPSAPPSSEVRKKVAIKYRDPATGQCWTGRGIKPRWLQSALAAGHILDDYLITGRE